MFKWLFGQKKDTLKPPAPHSAEAGGAGAGPALQRPIEIALQHHNAGRLSEAEAVYREMLAINPADIDALHFSGVAAHQRGDHERAAQLISRALSFNPSNAPAQNNLGIAFAAQGKRDEATACYRKALALAPDYFDALFNLGNSLNERGDFEEAVACYQKTVTLRPSSPEAHFRLALSLAYQGKLRESVEHFVSARKINPGNPGFQETLFPILVTLLQESREPGPARPETLPPLAEQPLVSVIIPTQNRVRMLHDALNSVWRQRYPNWEAIVVNDGGEGIAPVLQSLPDDARARIRHIELKTARGPAAARNAAIKVAKGDILAFLDDDDLHASRHLECLVSGLRASGAGLAYTVAELVKEMVRDGTRMESSRKPFLPGLRYSRPLLLVRNYIPINTWGVRRECFDAVGAFDESLRYLEDWDFLLRASARFGFHQTNEVTAEYRVTERTGDSLTKRHSHALSVRSFYQRHDAHGSEWVGLARELYLESLA